MSVRCRRCGFMVSVVLLVALLPADAVGRGVSVLYGGPRTGGKPVAARRYSGDGGVVLYRYGVAGCPAYDVILPPGYNLDRLRLKVRGGRLVSLGSTYAIWRTAEGWVVHRDLAVYQPGEQGFRRVPAAFCRRGDAVGIEVRRYDRRCPLIIDPEILNLSYGGGSEMDAGAAIAVGSDGSVYLAGRTTVSGQTDVLVIKLGPEATGVVYSTVISGGADEQATGIAVDDSGAAYLCGYTFSTDFPVVNAVQSTPGGGVDAFVCKLDAAGTNLLFSTYLGGRDNDYAEDIVLATDGTLAVAGFTLSDDFPLRAAYQTNLLGDRDAFVTVYPSNLGSYSFSSYLGGDSREYCYGVLIGTNGEVVVCGYTYSSNFPVSSGAAQGALAGGADIFVAALKPFSLEYATYLGGSGSDFGVDLCALSDGSLGVVGRTFSSDFPLCSPFQTNLAGDSDMIVAWLAPGATSVLFSSYLGGSKTDIGQGITGDSTGRLFVCGYTLSTNLPVRLPVQDGARGYYDGVVAGVEPHSGELLYCTYLGGSVTDRCRAVALQTNGGVVVAGSTDSPDLAVTNSFQSSYGGNGDLLFAWLPYYPLPLPVSAVLSNGTLHLRWPGGRGWRFTVQQSDDLLAAGWVTAGTNSNLSGRDAEMTAEVPADSAVRFVRVMGE